MIPLPLVKSVIRSCQAPYLFMEPLDLEIISRLANELDVSLLDLVDNTSESPKKYKVYKIAKRTVGYRIIAQPSKGLKKIQSKLVEILSEYIPIHKSAYAYRKKLSIKDNALLHSKSKYILKMDFANFFNSITPDVLEKTLKKHYKIDIEEFNVIKNILFWNPSKKTGGKLVLSVGAPSSPFISNAISYEFDTFCENICELFGATYSRYADDITFSTNHKNLLFPLEAVIRTNISNHFEDRIQINPLKTVFSSKAHNRHVTGITLNNENHISLGRKKKRLIKHLIHVQIIKPDDKTLPTLQGIIAYATHIEPTFIDAMRRKYGSHIIDSIKKGHKIDR